MGAVGGMDQLRGDPKTIAGPADAALKEVGHPKRFSDLTNVLILALEGKGRGAGDNLESRDLAERFAPCS